jgi:hypothetical protein
MNKKGEIGLITSLIIIFSLVIVGIFVYFKYVKQTGCESEKDQLLRDTCYYNQAMDSGDSSQCEKIRTV